MIRDLFQDVRHALRSLARSPAFAATAVLILALGIGANTTIFTVVDQVLFGKPPHVETEGLVRVNWISDGSSDWWAYPDYVDLRDATSDVFSGVAGYLTTDLAVTAAGGEAGGGQRHDARAWLVSANYFDVLGVRPALGRTFADDEESLAGAAPVAVVSHGFWQSALGGRADAAGSVLRLNGQPFTVVGVLPAGFRGVDPGDTTPDVWVPLTNQPILLPGTDAAYLERDPDSRVTWLMLLGRLRPGIGRQAAQARLDVVGPALFAKVPAWEQTRERRVELVDDYKMLPEDRERVTRLSRLLMGIVGIVFLIAGANVALLLLARTSARRRDLGIRTALGAGRGQIVRSLLTESLLLAAAGGALGYAVAFWSADVAASLMPFGLHVDFAPDLRVLLFTTGLTIGAAVLFGVLPALRSTRLDAFQVLRSGGTPAERAWGQGALVVAQVALSVVLVTGAALFVRSLRAAESVDLGFDAEDRLVLKINPLQHGYEGEAAIQLTENLLERLGHVPGVVAVTSTDRLAFRSASTTRMRSDGVDLEQQGEKGLGVYRKRVGPGYFETLGIEVLQGRSIRAQDRQGSLPVAVVNEAAALQFWPHADPIGGQLSYGHSGETPLTVVGVVRDTRFHRLSGEPEPYVFLPALQNGSYYVHFIVRTAPGQEQRALVRNLKAEIRAVDPEIAFHEIQTMEDAVERALGRFRVAAILVSLFGGLALLLAAVGLYGVLSYLVARRVRAIGIRMAVGATPRTVARWVVTRGLRLVTFGIVLGMAAALASARLVESFLYGVNSRDPFSFLAVPVVLLTVAGLAGLMPSMRAARIDPIEALRQE